MGDSIAGGDQAGVVESVKAASDIYSPLTGEVLAVNESLEDEPELVNSDPYNDGWFFRLQPEDLSELEGLNLRVRVGALDLRQQQLAEVRLGEARLAAASAAVHAEERVRELPAAHHDRRPDRVEVPRELATSRRQVEPVAHGHDLARHAQVLVQDVRQLDRADPLRAPDEARRLVADPAQRGLHLVMRRHGRRRVRVDAKPRTQRLRGVPYERLSGWS